jgi:hypothetical protein
LLESIVYFQIDLHQLAANKSSATVLDFFSLSDLLIAVTIASRLADSISAHF